MRILFSLQSIGVVITDINKNIRFKESQMTGFHSNSTYLDFNQATNEIKTPVHTKDLADSKLLIWYGKDLAFAKGLKNVNSSVPQVPSRQTAVEVRTFGNE